MRFNLKMVWKMMKVWIMNQILKKSSYKSKTRFLQNKTLTKVKTMFLTKMENLNNQMIHQQIKKP